MVNRLPNWLFQARKGGFGSGRVRRICVNASVGAG
jgi:hypothetical protein